MWDCPAPSSSATAGCASPKTWRTSEETNASSAEDATMATDRPFCVREATSASLNGCDCTPSGPRSRISGEILETLKLFQWPSQPAGTRANKCTAVDRFPSSYLKYFLFNTIDPLYGGG